VEDVISINSVYWNIWKICKTKRNKLFLPPAFGATHSPPTPQYRYSGPYYCLFFSQVGFQSSGKVTLHKLVEKGSKREDRALADLVGFPVGVFASYIAAQWSKRDKPLRAWVWAFRPRLGLALVAPLMIYWFPDPSISMGSRFCWMAWQVQVSFFEYVFYDGNYIRLSYYIYSQDSPICSYCSVPQQGF